MAALWHILQCKPHKEQFLVAQLLAHQVEAFCPHICVQPVNPRARKPKPCFPGYVFLRIELKQSMPSALQWMPGTRGFVAFDGRPAYVQEDLVRAIRRHVDEINGKDIERGRAVTVWDGPFTRYEAIFDSHLSASERATVLLKTLQDRQETSTTGNVVKAGDA